MSDVIDRCASSLLRVRHERARDTLRFGGKVSTITAAREDVIHALRELRPGDILPARRRVVAEADLLIVQAVVYRLGDADAIAAIERLMFGVDAEKPARP